ncbi:MAG: methyl-accepting chemotaxis protein [Treponema sp.]|nr:methyl-accepting chemotaxis protein [Treponema sp.]
MSDKKTVTSKVNFFSSIINRLLLSFVFIFALLVVLILLTVRINTKKGLTEYFSTQLYAKQRQLSALVETKRTELRMQGEFISRNLSGENWDVYSEDTEALEAFLFNMKNSFYSDGYIIYDKDYMPVAQNSNYDLKISPVILDAVLRGEKYLDLLKVGSDVFIVSGSPITDLEDEVQTAVFAVNRLSSRGFVNEVAETAACDFTFFDGYKRYATSLDKMAGTTIDNKKIIDQATYESDFVDILKIGEKRYLSLYTPLRDNSESPLSVLFLGIEVTVITDLVFSIFSTVIPFAVIFSLVVLVLLYFLIFKPLLSKPLRSLNHTIASLNTDEADLTLRLPVKEKHKSEFDLIYCDVNAFIEKLYTIINQLVQAQDQLLNVVDNLSLNSEQSASAISQIMANIEGVRHQSENQSVSVGNTSGVLISSGEEVNKLAKLIDEENQGINNSSASIEEMLANIRSVSENVMKLAKGFEELSSRVADGQRKLDQVNKSVLQIEAQSASLNDANSIISQISSQTNLLAMNAAIEAAHAGEAGKGFSVVADEIRKLAEDSAAQTKKIADDLKGIKGTISAVVVDTQESAKSFDQIVNNIQYTTTIMTEISSSMEEQEEASKQVFEALSDMKNQSLEVDEKSKVLETGVRKVVEEMANVTQISDTILGSMDEMANGAKDINDSAQNVQSLAQTTKETTGTIDSLLKQFKIN